MLDFNKTISLGKVAAKSKTKNEVTLKLTITLISQNGRDWDTLQPTNGPRISICGAVWNSKHTDSSNMSFEFGDWLSGGQNIDTIREYFHNDPKVMRICELWEEWHLNDMQAGTKTQMTFIKNSKLDKVDWYNKAKAKLASNNLLIDRGYTFGSEWLMKVPPEEVIEELKSLFV